MVHFAEEIENGRNCLRDKTKRMSLENELMQSAGILLIILYSVGSRAQNFGLLAKLSDKYPENAFVMNINIGLECARVWKLGFGVSKTHM